MDTVYQAENEALTLLRLVPLAGLEPATHGLGIRCSVHTELQGYTQDVKQQLNNLSVYRPFCNPNDNPEINTN